MTTTGQIKSFSVLYSYETSTKENLQVAYFIREIRTRISLDCNGTPKRLIRIQLWIGIQVVRSSFLLRTLLIYVNQVVLSKAFICIPILTSNDWPCNRWRRTFEVVEQNDPSSGSRYSCRNVSLSELIRRVPNWIDDVSSSRPRAFILVLWKF